MSGTDNPWPAGHLAAAVTTRWWWVRHAPVTSDNGRIYGQSDLDCDCGDAALFGALAAALPQDAVWVTSHLRRTHQTARAIWAAGGREAPFIEVPAFAEQHLGAWQGQDRAGFFADRPLDPKSYWFAPADERPPDGESFADLMARVAPAVERLTAAHRGRNIIAVAHGGTIRAAVALALGLDPQAALAFAIANCSLTRLDHLETPDHAGWRVAMVNHQPRVAPS